MGQNSRHINTRDFAPKLKIQMRLSYLLGIHASGMYITGIYDTDSSRQLLGHGVYLDIQWTALQVRIRQVIVCTLLPSSWSLFSSQADQKTISPNQTHHSNPT